METNTYTLTVNGQEYRVDSTFDPNRLPDEQYAFRAYALVNGDAIPVEFISDFIKGNTETYFTDILFVSGASVSRMAGIIGASVAYLNAFYEQYDRENA